MRQFGLTHTDPSSFASGRIVGAALVALLGFVAWASVASASTLFYGIERRITFETGDPTSGYERDDLEIFGNILAGGGFDGSISRAYTPGGSFSNDWIDTGSTGGLDGAPGSLVESRSLLDLDLDGLELDNIGSTSVFVTADYAFDAVLRSPVGFDSNRALLEATVAIDGFFQYVEPDGGPAGARGAMNATFGPAGGVRDQKGAFFSPTGPAVGSVELTSLLSPETTTVGGFRRFTLTSFGSFTLRGEIPVTPGATEQVVRLAFSHGMELGVLNTTGSTAEYSGDYSANFGGSTITLERVVPLDDGVTIGAVIPEPSTALLLGLGLLGLSGSRRTASR